MGPVSQSITKDLIAQHNLTDDEYKKIVGILGREPNITELGMFSVIQSSHGRLVVAVGVDTSTTRIPC